VTDPYQPLEPRLELTRRCLAVLAEFRQAASIITKNRPVTRDVALLGELARHGAAGVVLSITSLDPELAGRLEPRTTRPAGHRAAISHRQPTGGAEPKPLAGLNRRIPQAGTRTTHALLVVIGVRLRAFVACPPLLLSHFASPFCYAPAQSHE